MGFVLLEELIGIDVGILIIEADNSSDMNKVWTHMVQESSSIDVGRERPVYCVLYQTFLEVWVTFSHSPYFFESNSIMLDTGIIFF